MKFMISLFAALVMVVATVICLDQVASAAPATSFVVNHVGDEGDMAAGDGHCATTGGVCTLRAALEESNALAGTDEITFALPPTSTIAASSAELLITDSVTISGPGAEQLNVNSGFAFHRVLHIAAGAEGVIYINGLTIGGGILPEGHGGGILLEESTLSLNAVLVQYSVAQNGRGGGIAVAGGKLFLDGSAFVHNTADELGGAIYSDALSTMVITGTFVAHNSAARGGGVANLGQLTAQNSGFSYNQAEEGGGILNTTGVFTLTNSQLRGNEAERGAGLYQDALAISISSIVATTFEANISNDTGGAIYNFRQLSVVGSTLQENQASSGGAIFNYGTMILNQSLVKDNLALSRGGGIYNYVGMLTINQSTLANNHSSGGVAMDIAGGAIHNYVGDVTINNSTISGNSADETAGGIYNTGGTMQINHSTVAFNDAPDGGGIFVNDGAVTQIRNSIIARNGSGGDCVVVAGNPNGLIAFNANLDSDGTCPLFTLPNQEPLLSILLDNGGETPTHLLDPNSPAVNAASPDGCTDAGNVDQRGLVRLSEGDSACDLGAVERDGTQPPMPAEPLEPAEPTEPPAPATPALTMYLPMVERTE